MMKLYDRKDIGILVQTFNAVAPDSPGQKAMLLCDVAQHVGISWTSLVHEVNRVITEKLLQEQTMPLPTNVVLLPRIPYKD